MLKAFLSHSSKDKSYVERVAKEITTNWCIYDAFSFEEASETAEEIVNKLNDSDIFVFFISNTSLDSKWVKKELESTHELLSKGKMKRILPIIIDEKVTHKDTRIPEWLSNTYNIQPIRKYKKAVHRIRQELIRLSWNIDSNKNSIDNLFVGRNTLIDTLEGVYRKEFIPPIAIIASGITGIGRKSLLREYMTKVRIAEKSKYIPSIVLNPEESIEDFIFKLNDLGLSNVEINFKSLIGLKLENKINILYNIMIDIQEEKEIINIEDNGCLVLPNSELNNWFYLLLEKIESEKEIKNMIFSIISKYKMLKKINTELKSVYAIDVKELESKEIDWMFMEHLKIHKYELSQAEYKFIRDLLYGHPEQILYAVDILRYEGFNYIKENSNLLVDFNSTRVSYILTQYKSNDDAKSLLSLLSKFDFIDYELLNELIGDNNTYKMLIKSFISESICNEIGANKDSIKLNKAIRDVVRRNNWNENVDLKKKIQSHIDSFIKTFETEEKSLSDYLYSLQEVLVQSPDKINLSEIIPSHILKTIVTLYDSKKKWHSVISLAENVLYENFNELDPQIENQVRNFMCMACIKVGEEIKFFTEVKKVRGPVHNFMLGFYYRNKRRYADSIIKLKEAIKERPDYTKAKGELVQVYLSVHDYETALGLAKENFNSSPHNPYLFQAYSTSLIKTYNNGDNDSELDRIFKIFKSYKSNTDKASEMYDVEYARFLSAKKEKNAIDKIDDAILLYPNSIYPTIAKFDICDKLNEVDLMSDVLDVLKEKKDNLPNKALIIINEAILSARKGKKEYARNMIERLANYPEKSRKGLIDRINNY